MPGGLLQLSSYGSENQYLNGNPQITFFKQIYRRYTNFAMETIDISLEGSDELSNDKTTTVKVKIPRNADLINAMFLRVTLPDIYSSIDKEFFWTRGVGLAMINYVDLTIGGSKIERITGEFLDIYSQLNDSNEKRKLFKKITGDLPELCYHSYDTYYQGYDKDPTQNVFTFGSGVGTTIIPNKFYNTRPSIKGRDLHIPLNFWFMRENGCSIPLISLQYHDIEVEIEFKAVKDLYTILINDDSVNNPAPFKFNGSMTDDVKNIHHLEKYRGKNNETIAQYIYPGIDTNNQKTWQFKPELEINYVFLDDEERKIFAQNTHEYLIEQTVKFNELGCYGNKIIELEAYHPVKELLFTVSRNDNDERNEWLNFTGLEQRPIENQDIFEYNDNLWYQSTFFIKNASDPTQAPPYPQENFMYYYGDPGDYTVDFNNQSKFYTSYTTKDFIKFRNIWPYKKINNIPKINRDNYTLWEQDALISMEIKFNGFTRQDRRKHEYYNNVQNYLYYKGHPEQPIYTYSFCLNPSNYQPSGACNFSKVKNFTLDLKLKDPPFKNNKREWEYNVTVYLINYNILKIANGLGGLIFAN